jgi:hypothetical protein
MNIRPYTVEEVLGVLRRKCEEVYIEDGAGRGSQAFAYFHAGKFLGQCLWRLVPEGATLEAWHERLLRVREESDASGTVAWFEREIPQLIGLIPPDHRPGFAAAALDMASVMPANPARHESRNLKRRTRNRKRAERRKRPGQIDNTSS